MHDMQCWVSAPRYAWELLDCQACTASDLLDDGGLQRTATELACFTSPATCTWPASRIHTPSSSGKLSAQLTRRPAASGSASWPGALLLTAVLLQSGMPAAPNLRPLTSGRSGQELHRSRGGAILACQMQQWPLGHPTLTNSPSNYCGCERLYMPVVWSMPCSHTRHSLQPAVSQAMHAKSLGPCAGWCSN